MVYKVLVFPGGTEIGLEIQKSLLHCKDIQIYSAGSRISNHASLVFKNHFIIPSVSETDWLNSLNEIIIHEGIDYIFPAHDDVIVALAENIKSLKAKIVSSPQETCLITRSKSATYRLLADIIPVPKLYIDIEQISTYPVFLKPDKGQGSQGTQLIDNQEYLYQYLHNNQQQNLIFMEYLPGDEYTIDCFSDRDRGLLFCSGRERSRIRSGISMNSKTVHNQSEIFQKYACLIAEKLCFHGAWFFQLKKDQYGIYKLLEIAPRIAGTMAVHRVKGINFPLLSIYEQERIPIEILINQIDVSIDRALINRYKHHIEYNKVYVDLDDTLILNGKLNLELIKFLYQCLNRDINIILITKHKGDVKETLSKYRIFSIFDQIIHIDSRSSKADYICDDKSILIDDSFSERKDVSKRLGILTFDCSMLEMLLDERN
ncbi:MULTISPECIES: ATP-grasp domain-containing protein [unclassified Tolypothrix]|uniref:ATP-grasp domain-containing protein n=1 Tax=unclassified Tolypothrix TaxID=2649714 RepID=UPI0005EAAA17|nr:MULTISPECIES: ATP-grasp domain-containing protein [unclassified Tolypothrix]BAY92024.1 putative carbamoylphosphate synthase large subunit short form [Microchaete diplosiphon NIES-3275]EKF04780.1 ATP-grasp domain protein [Tolypothrix sp. PCC 7601]MBE9081771.1 ATP-grasp domain-containing protein [Tolypothrix sp. LEGE 11397]UYD26012.1 ATP-grasp domain-containing protein [Tolypothrix sp. PCC 7712]UYD31749.1 ATP-grasp domain-containing protein [Tolypothrix sp. PCC 7601]